MAKTKYTKAGATTRSSKLSNALLPASSRKNRATIRNLRYKVSKQQEELDTATEYFDDYDQKCAQVRMLSAEVVRLKRVVSNHCKIVSYSTTRMLQMINQ